MSERVVGKKRPLDERSLQNFFESRAEKYDPEIPYVSMMYQDKNPGLAIRRDKHEKKIIVPLLNLRPEDRLLDIGCGIGRWADVVVPRVAWYHGVDKFHSLINIAQSRFQGRDNVEFQTIGAEDLDRLELADVPPFNVFMIAGVLMYLNDDVCRHVMKAVTSLAADRCCIMIREPIGLEKRLTLDRVWSEELEQTYSAIYRTRSEFLTLFDSTFSARGFRIDRDQPLFPKELNNRADTRQHLFLLRREA